MSQRPRNPDAARAPRLAHVLRVGTWRGGPQPATIRPSEEDVRRTLYVKFGDPEKAEEAEEEAEEAERQRQARLAEEKAEEAEEAEEEVPAPRPAPDGLIEDFDESDPLVVVPLLEVEEVNGLWSLSRGEKAARNFMDHAKKMYNLYDQRDMPRLRQIYNAAERAAVRQLPALVLELQRANPIATHIPRFREAYYLAERILAEHHDESRDTLGKRLWKRLEHYVFFGY